MVSVYCNSHFDGLYYTDYYNYHNKQSVRRC